MKDLEIIKTSVDNYFGFDISKKNRERRYVLARGVYFDIAIEQPNITLKKIGEVVDRDHATVLHFKKKKENYYKTEAVFNDAVKDLKPSLKYLLKYGSNLKVDDKFKTHLSTQYEIVQKKNKLLLSLLSKEIGKKDVLKEIKEVIGDLPLEAMPELKERMNPFVKMYNSRKTYENTTREERG